jgi:polar amino acid transport system substrate-binding protein
MFLFLFNWKGNEKMKLSKILIGLIAGALLFTSFARADALDDIQKKGVLRVAVPQDFPPFGSVTTELKPQGLDINVATLIAQKLDVKVELVPVTSANRIPYLQTKKVDLVISKMGKNPEREKVIDFIAAYAPFFNGVFGPADQKVAGPADLAGKTIGVTRGSVEDLELSKIAPATATIKRYEDNNGTISSFLSNQVQLVATGNVIAAAIIAKNPPKKPKTKFLIKDSPCSIGMNKG